MNPFETAFYLFVFLGGILMLIRRYRGPIFVPTRRKHVPVIIELLAIKPGEKVVDLGSGDGRLMIAIVEAGGAAYGYEHSPLLAMRSKRNFKKAGVSDQAVVYTENFWKADLSEYNAVVIYGIPYIMTNLEKKLQKELKPGARVVSYSFPFPTWKPTEKNKQIFLYIKK